MDNIKIKNESLYTYIQVIFTGRYEEDEQIDMNLTTSIIVIINSWII